MRITPKAVAFIGKLGHGKTRLLNALTGTSFPSNMSARSCTEHLQYGYSRNGKILVVDTPGTFLAVHVGFVMRLVVADPSLSTVQMSVAGFYASDDVAKHIAAQKIALEGLELSGVYVVIKYDRADLIAQAVNKMMDFVGDDQLRILITHADTASLETGFDPAELLSALNRLINIPVEHMAVVGKNTSADDIESFIASTLHDPKFFTISPEQVASISSLCVINRKTNKKIDEVFSKISAASSACEEVVKGGRSYETDVAIGTTQSVTETMVSNDKEKIFRSAEDQGLTLEEKNLIYGKAGLALSLRLKSFMDSTNKLLSWDVTNISDPRNIYRKCNHCGAVFNKTEGCDGETICGAVPKETKRPRPQLIAEFRCTGSIWTVQYLWNGREVLVQYVLTQLRALYQNGTVETGGGVNHTKRSDAVFESGCGNKISWSTMLPVDLALVQMLGSVEIQRAGPMESASKSMFDERMDYHEKVNEDILRAAVP